MSSRQPSDLPVYLLKRRNGFLLVSSLEKTGRAEDIGALVIHSASNLLDNDTDYLVRAQLLQQGQRAVSHVIQERHYIPRLLFSALGFLLVYFFCSLVIRDPIPMVDELILAALAAVVIWMLMRQRDVKNAYGDKLFIDLSKKIRSAQVFQDETLLPVEDALYEIENYNILALSDILAHCSEEKLPSLSSKPSDEFIKLLASMLSDKEKRMLKEVRSVRERNPRLSARLYAAAAEKKIDLPLIALVSILEK